MTGPPPTLCPTTPPRRLPEKLARTSGVTKAAAHPPKPAVPPADSAPNDPIDNDPIDLEALLSGDRQAFALLVRRESPRLFQVILRIVRDEDEARSVMQETFLQAYQRLATFRREARFTTWLYAIGINQARAAARRLRRHDVLDEQDIDRLQPTFRNGMYVSRYQPWNPQQAAERTELHHLVHEAIDRLPDIYRTVVVLRDLEERSTTETA
ncbi:MAG: sigma-70 family RNA polymerase sigma factor, partial [Bacteroidetes bacterium]